jgi:hypothetical protein
MREEFRRLKKKKRDCQCKRTDKQGCNGKDEIDNKKKEFYAKSVKEERVIRDTSAYASGAPGTDWKQRMRRG